MRTASMLLFIVVHFFQSTDKFLDNVDVALHDIVRPVRYIVSSPLTSGKRANGFQQSCQCMFHTNDHLLEPGGGGARTTSAFTFGTFASGGVVDFLSQHPVDFDGPVPVAFVPRFVVVRKRQLVPLALWEPRGFYKCRQALVATKRSVTVLVLCMRVGVHHDGQHFALTVGSLTLQRILLLRTTMGTSKHVTFVCIRT